MKDRVEAARQKTAGQRVGGGGLGSPQAGRLLVYVVVPCPSTLSH